MAVGVGVNVGVGVLVGVGVGVGVLVGDDVGAAVGAGVLEGEIFIVGEISASGETLAFTSERPVFVSADFTA